LEGLIPEEVVDRVRSATDIVDVISGYVTLKKSGANFSGLCPFHSEKTPSFSVSPSKQIYHCFGCGAGGDAVGFLIRSENLSFPEAVRRLADRAGIIIPETKRAGGDEEALEPLYKANQEAARFFAQCLLESPEGKKALDYLKSRDFPLEAAREFGLGYSPSAWDGLLRRLERAGIPAALAERAGLAVKRSSGDGHYDRFRDRLMFPIKDTRGRVTAFGGRSLGDSEPKYLNSPETRTFRKGETLYLLDLAAEAVRKRGFSIVAEGYFDAIALHRAGVKNAVATLGTALTPGHLRALGRFAKKVLVVFDSDPAGIKAAERSLDVFLGADVTAKVVLLPKGDDPDSLLRREGADALTEAISVSTPLTEFVIARLADAAVDIDGKVEASSKVASILAKIRNGVERAHYLKFAAERLGTGEQALNEELGKELGRPARYEAPARPRPAAPNKIEEELVHLLINYPEVLAETRVALTPAEFSDDRLRPVVERVYRAYDEHGEVDARRLIDASADEAERELVSKLAMGDTRFDDPVEYARGSAARLMSGGVDRKLAELSARIRRAEQDSDYDLLNKLQKEFIEWQKKKSSTK